LKVVDRSTWIPCGAWVSFNEELKVCLSISFLVLTHVCIL